MHYNKQCMQDFAFKYIFAHAKKVGKLLTTTSSTTYQQYTRIGKVSRVVSN